VGFEERTKMQGRRELARRVLKGELSLSEACREAGVSRPTGYKWVRRAEAMGVEDMAELSRRPHRIARATGEEVVREILALKAARPVRGAKKLVAERWPEHKGMEAPICVRTADRILARHGLVRKREVPAKVGSFERGACNELLQTDFKGMGRKPHRYVPLTVVDDHSRYCMAFEPLAGERWEGVWEVLWGLFGEYGLPESILSDNGSCFHSVRSRGPSRLEVRLWRLGVRTIHGRRRHPQTQGKVERLHRTMNEETPVPLRQMTLEQAREVLPEVVRVYNWERPHEALGMRVPGEVYTPSPRRRPDRLPTHELPESATKRKVDAAGLISYRGRRYRAGKGLVSEYVEIREHHKGEAIYYAGVRIASLHTLKV
jgi:transposase InsO family protein